MAKKTLPNRFVPSSGYIVLLWSMVSFANLQESEVELVEAQARGIQPTRQLVHFVYL